MFWVQMAMSEPSGPSNTRKCSLWQSWVEPSKLPGTYTMNGQEYKTPGGEVPIAPAETMEIKDLPKPKAVKTGKW